MYKTELRVPGRGASFQCLPAEPKRLEGLDYTLAILDEIGVIARDSYEVVHLAQGKRGVDADRYRRTGPGPAQQRAGRSAHLCVGQSRRPSLVWREFSGSRLRGPPGGLCAPPGGGQPGVGRLLAPGCHERALPPKTREATFRRARLCQFIRDTDGKFLPPGVWDGLATGQPIPDGA